MNTGALRLLEAFLRTFLDVLYTAVTRGIPLVDILAVVTVVSLFVVLAHQYIGFGIVIFSLLLVVSIIIGSAVVVLTRRPRG